jgi:hypothetical protein
MKFLSLRATFQYPNQRKPENAKMEEMEFTPCGFAPCAKYSPQYGRGL